MSLPTVYMTVGSSSSGKTSWAKEQIKNDPTGVIVCRDDIRVSLGYPPMGNQEQEKHVTVIERDQVAAAIARGVTVYWANTNLNSGIRNANIRFAHKHRANVKLVPFQADKATLLERNANRTAQVPVKVIEKHHDQFNNWNNHQPQLDFPCPTFAPYEHTEGRIGVYVSDIDSTVANCEGVRSPYDHTKVLYDKPIPDNVRVVNALSHSARIIFVSGRKDLCYDDTLLWLQEHFTFPINLHMRKADDDRVDFVVKQEILDEHIIPNYNIIAYLDDRQQCIRHARARGITVFDVANNSF